MASKSKHSTIALSLELEDPRVAGHLYVPYENKFFFRNGDIIRGRVVVDIVHPQPIEEIRIKFCCVLWHKKVPFNNDVDLPSLIASNTNHRRAHILFEHEELLLNTERRFVFESEYASENPFLENGDLRSKKHVFPFYFHIVGSDRNSLFVPPTYEDSNIKILHFLHVGVFRPHPVRPVIAVQPVDVIRSVEKLFPPLPDPEICLFRSTENKVFGKLGSGAVEVEVRIPKSTWIPGDTVPINCLVTNSGAKTIRAIQVIAIRHMAYRGLDDKSDQTDEIILSAEHSVMIPSGSVQVGVNVDIKLSPRPTILRQLKHNDTSSTFTPHPDLIAEEQKEYQARQKKTPPPTFFASSLYSQLEMPEILSINHTLMVAIHIGSSEKTKRLAQDGASSRSSSSRSLTVSQVPVKDSNPVLDALSKVSKIGAESKILKFEIPLIFFTKLPTMEDMPPGPPSMMNLPTPPENFVARQHQDHVPRMRNNLEQDVLVMSPMHPYMHGTYNGGTPNMMMTHKEPTAMLNYTRGAYHDSNIYAQTISPQHIPPGTYNPGMRADPMMYGAESPDRRPRSSYGDVLGSHQATHSPNMGSSGGSMQTQNTLMSPRQRKKIESRLMTEAGGIDGGSADPTELAMVKNKSASSLGNAIGKSRESLGGQLSKPSSEHMLRDESGPLGGSSTSGLALGVNGSGGSSNGGNALNPNATSLPQLTQLNGGGASNPALANGGGNFKTHTGMPMAGDDNTPRQATLGAAAHSSTPSMLDGATMVPIPVQQLIPLQVTIKKPPEDDAVKKLLSEFEFLSA